MRASEGRFIATEMANSAQRYGGVAEMIAQGDLDGKKVALWWDGPVDAEFADLVRPLLVDADIEIVAEVEVGDFGQDQIAADNAADQRMERIVSSGADFVLGLSNIVPVTEAAERANYDGIIGFTNGQAADQTVFPEAELSDDSAVPANTFAITTNKPTPEEALADPGVTQCLDEYNAAYDEPIDLESKTTIQALVNHCRAFRSDGDDLRGGRRRPESRLVRRGRGRDGHVRSPGHGECHPRTRQPRRRQPDPPLRVRRRGRFPPARR